MSQFQIDLEEKLKQEKSIYLVHIRDKLNRLEELSVGHRIYLDKKVETPIVRQYLIAPLHSISDIDKLNNFTQDFIESFFTGMRIKYHKQSSFEMDPYYTYLMKFAKIKINTKDNIKTTIAIFPSKYIATAVHFNRIRESDGFMYSCFDLIKYDKGFLKALNS